MSPPKDPPNAKDASTDPAPDAGAASKARQAVDATASVAPEANRVKLPPPKPGTARFRVKSPIALGGRHYAVGDIVDVDEENYRALAGALEAEPNW